MRIGSGEHTYEWHDNWATIPDTELGRVDGRTHGVVASETGHVLVFHQADPAVLVLDERGKLQATWGDRFKGAHGMSLVKDGDSEYLWLADVQSKEVVKTTLDGKTVQQLEQPKIDAYKEGGYVPTWVAVNETRFGGNGDVWVADGYGKSLVHRFNAAGEYLATIDGREGEAGAFACPHGIKFDNRHGRNELYIADRGNKRVQVYDSQGNFKRVFGSDFLNSPCMFDTHGEFLLIPELHARLAILDGKDQLVCYLGDNGRVKEVKGWPNLPAEHIQAGKFNSPHGMTADAKGNLYVAEWIIGGRITKLEKAG